MTIPEHKNFNTQRLVSILQKPRGGDAHGIQRFMHWWFRQFSTLEPTEDAYGNFHHEVLREDGTHSTTLFTAHTDTVDSTNKNLKNLGYIESEDILVLHGAQPKGISCLGADDGAGCEILVALAEANVPGYYLWTMEEECGCVGIKGALADKTVDFTQFNRAVAFDRAGMTDVITYQMGGTCCSDDFALELAVQLGGEFMPCNFGVFTDTAMLIDTIPECTNLSIGYEDQHSYNESLNLKFMDGLVGRCIGIQWDLLPTVCTPKPRFTYAGGYTGSRNLYGSYSYWPASDICKYSPSFVESFIKKRNLTKALEDAYNDTKETETSPTTTIDTPSGSAGRQYGYPNGTRDAWDDDDDFSDKDYYGY